MNNADKYAGAKYQQGRDTAEIAKMFRADVKAAIKAGELPTGLDLGVRVQRYAGGSSINVTIKACPGLQVSNPGHVLAQEAIPYVFVEDIRIRFIHTEAARALMAKLEGMLEAYNRSEVDTQTDYFNVKFYGHVTFATEFSKADRAAVVASLDDLIGDCRVQATVSKDDAIRQCIAVAVGPVEAAA
jgi:hypothetical protein